MESAISLDLVDLCGEIMIKVMPLWRRAVQEIQQVHGVGIVEGRGGFIQDQQLDALGQGLGDLDELLLADADVLDLGVRLLRQADASEVLVGFGGGFEPVDDPVRGDLVAQEEVLHDAQLGDQCQFLVDDDDARVLALADAFELAQYPGLEDDLALRRSRTGGYRTGTFISVDLPAPFSPQIAWISPRLTFGVTSASALTPGNSLVIPFMERIVLSICPHPWQETKELRWTAPALDCERQGFRPGRPQSGK